MSVSHRNKIAALTRWNKKLLEILGRLQTVEVMVPDETNNSNHSYLSESLDSEQKDVEINPDKGKTVVRPTGFALYNTYQSDILGNSKAPQYAFVDMK